MRHVIVAIFVAFLLVIYNTTHAAVFTVNQNGTPYRWPNPAAPTFYTNWGNGNGLSYQQVFTAFTNSLSRWKHSGGTSLGFDYWQGQSSATPTERALDTRSSIFFSSKSTQKLSGSIIAVTSLFANGSQIVEADIEFNDEHFNFTMNPSDSSGVGTGKNVFIENVATHEFGHALGLNHSAVLQSSMVYLEHRAQAKPSCDDINAVAVMYPDSVYFSLRGTIQGQVLQAGNLPVFGAHVLAISKTRGAMVASTITDPNGSYTITGLEPGDYVVLFEAFQASAPLASLCQGMASNCFHGTINANKVCGNGTRPFERMFLESSPGTPQILTVAANTTTHANTANVASCTPMAHTWSGVTATGTAPTLFGNNSGLEKKSIVRGVFASPGNSHFYKLENVSGVLSAKVLTFSLYSKADTQVSFVDATGTLIPGSTSMADVFSNSSNFANFDSSALLSAASPTTVYLKISHGWNLNNSNFPAGSVLYQVDPTAFYLLIVTANDSTGLVPNNSSPTLTNNVRCEAADSFPAFQDHGPPAPPSNPPPPSPPPSRDKPKFCGTIENAEPRDDIAMAIATSPISVLVLIALAGTLGLRRRSIRVNLDKDR